MDLHPGATVGDIELTKQLGDHATGPVWAGYDRAHGREVMLKMASPEAVADDETLVERYRLESRAIREINSPHVVRVYDDGITDDGIPYVVSERVVGERLSARLAREAELPVVDVDRLVGQIASGLSAAHAVGIVHRDLGPEVIIMADGSPHPVAKIVDFGLAKVVGGRLFDPHLTMHGRLVGTPEYLSPERASAKRATPQADMWALAVLGYRGLTGVVPFAGDNRGLLLMRIIKSEFVAPSTLREGLSTDIDAFFLRAFDRDPQQRFAHAMDLATAFSHALAAADQALDWSL
jgi:serine/threonine-protein kinase